MDIEVNGLQSVICAYDSEGEYFYDYNNHIHYLVIDNIEVDKDIEILEWFGLDNIWYIFGIDVNYINIGGKYNE